MLVNPILLIFGLFFLGIVVCFYIVRRPTRSLSFRGLPAFADLVFRMHGGGQRFSSADFPV